MSQYIARLLMPRQASTHCIQLRPRWWWPGAQAGAPAAAAPWRPRARGAGTRDRCAPTARCPHTPGHGSY